jgi:hypothetical protein
MAQSRAERRRNPDFTQSSAELRGEEKETGFHAELRRKAKRGERNEIDANPNLGLLCVALRYSA